MSLTHELSGDLRQWEEQTTLSYARRFQAPGAEGEASGEILRSMVALQSGESATITANFASTTETISAQGSLALENFSGRVPQPFSSLPNVIVVTRYDWPLRAKPWGALVPGALLNTFLWVEEFQREEQTASERKGLVLSEEVLHFCSQHRLFGYLQLAARLVDDCFPSVEDVAVEKESDPESEDEWLLLTAQLHAQVEAVLSQYDTYTQRFMDSVPWPQRNKIRFNYDLI